MKEFFSNFFEWFGLNPLYTRDLGDHLKGFDVTCSGYFGTPLYSYIGWLLIIITFFSFILYYFIIDSPRFQLKSHWLIVLFFTIAVNFLIAFIMPYNDLKSGNYCIDLKISVADCIGFGLSSAIWAAVIFILLSLSPWPRNNSNNCRYTPWKQ